MTLTFAATAMLAFAPSGRESTPVTHDYKASYTYMKTLARKYHLQRDDLQRRLTRRVLEVRALQGKADSLALKLRRAYARSVDVLTSPEERNFLCIHGGEGRWDDPNAPFWGGVQMDLGFQKTYGREFYDHYGTADHWPVSVQIAVAIKATFTRGYWPWPNTARACGLLP